MIKAIDDAIAVFNANKMNVVAGLDEIESYVASSFIHTANHLELFLAFLEQMKPVNFRDGEQHFDDSNIFIMSSLKLNTLDDSKLSIRFQIGSTIEEYNTIISLNGVSIAIDMNAKKVSLNSHIKPEVEINRIETESLGEESLVNVMEETWEFDAKDNHFTDLLYNHPIFSTHLHQLVFG